MHSRPRARHRAQRSRCASAMRSRPSGALGPVEASVSNLHPFYGREIAARHGAPLWARALHRNGWALIRHDRFSRKLRPIPARALVEKSPNQASIRTPGAAGINRGASPPRSTPGFAFQQRRLSGGGNSALATSTRHDRPCANRRALSSSPVILAPLFFNGCPTRLQLCPAYNFRISTLK